MGNPKAVVAGHICLDITPVFPPQEALAEGELLKPGKLLQVGAADIHIGGAVANTGLAMKRLGVDVCLMGKVGKDPFGSIVLEQLEREGVREGMSIDPSGSTSYSVVLAVPGIDRMFLHHPGVNDSFSYEDIDWTQVEEADLFHLGYPPIMRMLYINKGRELERIFRDVYEKGVITSLDLAAVDPDSEAGGMDWEAILGSVLPYVDFFMPSLEELCFMVDRKRYDELTGDGKNSDMTAGLSISGDVEPLIRKTMELGARNLIVKCGAPGLYYHMGGRKALSRTGLRLNRDMSGWEEHSGFEKSYRPSRVLSATGAGDTTIAAFLAALLQGYPLRQCIQAAAATGASCVEAYDALSGLLPLNRQLERINNGLQKQELIDN